MKTKVFILIVIVLTSCGKNSKNHQNYTGTIKVIDLLAEPDSRLVNISDISSDVEYIPLESTENCLVRFIDKIITFKDIIYLKSSSEILCFKKEGEFLYKLSDSGRGPGQYNYLIDFDISSDGNTLMGLTDHKIMEYNITKNAFIFLNSINLKEPYPRYLSLVPGTTNILLSICPWLGTEQTLNILMTRDGDTLNLKSNCYKYKKSDQIRVMATPRDALQYASGNSACFKEVYSDTIFSVTKESNDFMPCIVFDSHGTVVNTKFRSDPEYRKNHQRDWSQIAYISEVPRYLFYHCFLLGERYKFIYDKVANKKFEIDMKVNLKDDICGGPNIVFGMNAASQGKFYSSVESLVLKKYVNRDDFNKNKVLNSKKREELKRLADSRKETDNPVLIVVTPKTQ